MSVISLLRLLLCSLCCTTCCGIVNAQPTLVFLPAPGELVSVESNDPPPLNSAADFLNALRAHTPVAVQNAIGLENEVVVWPELVGLETAEAYSPTPIRYLAIHLRIANTSAQAIEIHPAQLVLSAGPEKLKAGELPERFPAYYVELGDEMLEMEKIRKQQPVQVKAGQVAQLWTVFAPVPDLPIEIPLSLQIPWSTGTTQLDLRAISAARLELHAERIGPGNALGWMQIEGQFDTVNCHLVAAQIAAWTEAGVERYLISWGEQAPVFDVTLFEWLMQPLNPDRNDNALFSHMPRLHSTREFHLAKLPSQRPDSHESEGADIHQRYGKYVHATTAEAATAALASLYDTAAPEVLSEQLRSGHPLSVAALLKSVPHKLPAAELARVLELSRKDGNELRIAALQALGQFDAPEARERLQAALASDSEVEQLAATTALLTSPHRASLALVDHMLQTSTVSTDELIRLLVRYPHPAGESYLAGCLENQDPGIRRTALLALAALGHPDMLQLLDQKLNDPATEVRQTAFRLLSRRSDRDAERRAMLYAVTLLEQGEFDDSVREFLFRVRDPGVGTLLLTMLSKASADDQIAIVQLLGSIGDDFTSRELVQRFPKFNPDVQRVVLESLREQNSPLARELAMAQLDHEDVGVRSLAIDVLVESAGADVERALVVRLRKLMQTTGEPSQESLVLLLDGLSRLSGSEAKQALEAFRDFAFRQGYERALATALEALKARQQQSPGWNASQAGMYHWRQDKFDDAMRYFSLAVQIDPELVFAHQARGNILLKQEHLDEALVAFQTGYELDEFDGQSITGIGIIMARQGQPERAVQFTLESAPKFKQDDVFAYNTACVYGRAIEFLRTRPQTPERDALIDKYMAAAFAVLDRSIELDFADLELLETDPDLTSLHGQPQFNELVNKLRSEL